MLSKQLKVNLYQFNYCSLSDSVPDWNTEIGGLKQVKEQIEEIFGIT